MSSKERAHDKGAATPKRPSPLSSEENELVPNLRRTHPAVTYQLARAQPCALTPKEVLQLQRTVGNRAVAQLFAGTARRRPAQKESPPPRNQNNTGLPDDLKAGVENISGISLDDVRVHYNSAKPAKLRALAYTQGADIHVAPGQERHLPHEAWHAVQQKQGRVAPSVPGSAAPVNGDAGLEREADLKGAEAMRAPAPRRTRPRHAPLTAARPAVQRVVETETDYQEADSLSLLPLTEFDAYARKQADWFASGLITEDERDQFRRVLSFAREPNVLEACGKFYVDDISGLSDEELTSLRAYSEAVKSQQPFPLQVLDLPDDATFAGEQLRQLLGHFGKPLLTTAMNEEAFTNLVRLYGDHDSLVEDVIEYRQSATLKPYFEAESGEDFEAYVKLRDDDKKDPLDYDGSNLKQKIRNFHRFEGQTLEKLKQNYEDKSKSRPLTLILQSAVDHNGAFIRSAATNKVVTNANIHTLLVEGGETLEAYRDWIPTLAAEYGQAGKIDQVLLSGHGSMRSMQMAGTPEEQEDVDLDKPESVQFFQTLLDHLAPDLHQVLESEPLNLHRRVVFNACLTNTNYVPFTNLTDKEFDEAAEAVREYIAENPTLTEYVNSRIKERGLKASAEGANAVTRASGLIDEETGRLGLSSQDDTHLVADKLEYVAFGKEPVGVFRAAVECLADEKSGVREACLKDMETRALGEGGDWRNTFVKAGFALVLRQEPKDHLWLLSYLSTKADNIEAVIREHTARVAQVSFLGMFGDKAIPFFQAFKTSSTWRLDRFSLCMLQVWMRVQDEQTVRDEFLLILDKHNCAWLRPVVDIPELEKHSMEKLLTGPQSTARLKLALLGVLAPNPNERAKQYLLSLLEARDTFDPALRVDDALGGLSTSTLIQVRIGRPPRDYGQQEEVEANVRLLGGERNTDFIRSVTKRGRVTRVGGTDLRKRPANEGEVLGHIAEGEVVNVFGQGENWLGIEFSRDHAYEGYVRNEVLEGGGAEETDTTLHEATLYAEPDLEHSVIKLAENTEVRILERLADEQEGLLKVELTEPRRQFAAAFAAQTDLTLL